MLVCRWAQLGWVTLENWTRARYWGGTWTIQDTVDEGLMPSGQLGVASRAGPGNVGRMV